MIIYKMGYIQAIEDVLSLLDKWQKPSHLQLMAGEMSAQEKRSVFAVLGALRLQIERLGSQIGSEAPTGDFSTPR